MLHRRGGGERGRTSSSILDCCHSGGGTRDPFARPAGVGAPARRGRAGGPRRRGRAGRASGPSTEFLPGALDQWRAPRPPHVALAACRSTRRPRSTASATSTAAPSPSPSLESLDVLGSRTTYRSLLATVRSRVERTADEQRPGAVPARRRRPRATRCSSTARCVPVAAVVHRDPRRRPAGRSTPASSTGCATRSATRRSCSRAATTTARRPAWSACTDVDVGRSRVEPVGLGRRPTSPTAPWSSPCAAAAGRGAARPAGRRRPAAGRRRGRARRRACGGRHAGPGGRRRRPCASSTPTTASPGASAAPGVGARRRHGAHRPGRRHRRSSATSPDADGAGARLVVSRLEHVARWELVRALGDHPSPLADLVTLELFECDAG